ncbi:MFS transporter [Jannaschia sp. 2305UL9-9]|uniref:MFS transporter n=1 Tax=Jannaschia sp. 2305UL9-9 TaxID=3121638 RepID=UPI003528F813
MARRTSGLPRHAAFAAVLAAAGLPIYIHAPKFYVDSYGVTLAQLSVALFALRAIDVVQDPMLGRLAAVTAMHRTLMCWIAGGLMALSMVGLFAVEPMLPPVWWFALTLGGLFSSFSFLTICFYAQGVAKAASMGDGHVRLASWRETGALSGVCLAAALPAILAGTHAPFTIYALLFTVLTGVALWAMMPEWSGRGTVPGDSGLRAVLSDAPARRLLIIALANATPVAVTSTLFLFFVEDRLGAPEAAGPLLLVFFLAAAAAAPVWGRIARAWGAHSALMGGMILAIVSFGWALTLGAGDTLAFAMICVVSGAAVGADLTLLPAIFARRLQVITPGAADGFGLWSFVNKATLAMAAIALFPILDLAGFVPGTQNAPAALNMLTLLYAGLPLGLKILALILLIGARQDLQE